MAMSDKPYQTLDSGNLKLAGHNLVNYIRFVSKDAVAGDQCIVQDVDGDPVGEFCADGANFTDIIWIENYVDDLEITTLTGNRGTLYVYLRRRPR